MTFKLLALSAGVAAVVAAVAAGNRHKRRQMAPVVWPPDHGRPTPLFKVELPI